MGGWPCSHEAGTEEGIAVIFRNPAKEKLRAGGHVVGFNVFECLLPPSPCSGNLPIGPPGPPFPPNGAFRSRR